ncbi:MAG TPA: hypothetical protein VMJ73_17300 [Rhizomicrobium sp.]|nr:hypothetical protein [Rhizomicrobium sp.]
MLAEAATATNNRSTIVAALQQAAAATGADFNYLLGTATRESSLNPTAKAGTSSAAGLFQFVEQTWLGVVKTYGAKHGLASFANAITQGPDGKFHTSNPADRSAILALRKDPTVASLMEGEFAQATRANLEGSLGRSVCGGELYAAHFLGTDAACRLIRMNDSQPDATAANAFPAAADANRNVFFHKDGTAKTVHEVYDWALKQPNSGTLSAAPAKPSGNAAPTTTVRPDIDATPDSDALLASITSWNPSRGFFATDDGDSGASATPFLLSPGVMSLLTSINPVAVPRAAS